MTAPTPTPTPARSRPSAEARRGTSGRPRGIALLMALAVVMLLTFFMSEYFFATGLELRGMTTYKDAQQARILSRAVFKAVQVGLLLDEVEFFEAYDKLHALLEVAAVPWNEGLLLNLDIVPQDHLYNLNQNYRQQPGAPPDIARRILFVNTLADVEVPTKAPGGFSEPISADAMLALYAALFDWLDSDSDDYVDIPGVVGAEDRAYIGQEPEVSPKNGPLDRLSEIRIVRGVFQSGIPWGTWQQRFTTLPKVGDSTFYFTERINVNVASATEIQRFLEDRNIEPGNIGANENVQSGVNECAEMAAELAEFLAPIDGGREVYNKDLLKDALQTQFGIAEDYCVNYLFSTANEYYRIRIVTEVADVQARLEAMIHVPRDANTRTGTAVNLLWISLD